MMIHLPETIDQSLEAAVRSGRFPTVAAALTAAWLAYIGEVAQAIAAPVLTPDDIHRQMLADGLLSQLPDSRLDDDGDDPPIVVAGEPLSATILRERR